MSRHKLIFSHLGGFTGIISVTRLGTRRLTRDGSSGWNPLCDDPVFFFLILRFECRIGDTKRGVVYCCIGQLEFRRYSIFSRSPRAGGHIWLEQRLIRLARYRHLLYKSPRERIRALFFFLFLPAKIFTVVDCEQ